jgi:hypothetical protein
MEHWTLYLIIASISFIIFAIIGIDFLLKWTRDSFVFRPTRSNLSTPKEAYIDKEIGNVHTRWFRRGYKNVLFYLHGNNGNISDRNYVVEFTKLLGMDLVMMDYQGYGKSRGMPTIENMRSDALEVLRTILQLYPEENVTVMSESLGSIASSYIAAKQKVNKIIILSGISSFDTIAKKASSPLMRRTAEVALNDFDRVTNQHLLTKSLTPVVFVHSREDEIVPFKSAEDNVLTTPNSQLIEIEGGHSAPVISEQKLADLISSMGIEMPRLSQFTQWREAMATIGKLHDFRIIDT